MDQRHRYAHAQDDQRRYRTGELGYVTSHAGLEAGHAPSLRYSVLFGHQPGGGATAGPHHGQSSVNCSRVPCAVWLTCHVVSHGTIEMAVPRTVYDTPSPSSSYIGPTTSWSRSQSADCV